MLPAASGCGCLRSVCCWSAESGRITPDCTSKVDMLASVGLFLVSVCFVSQASARSAVTVLTRDYSYVPPKELLASNMHAVLENMAELQKVHPRLNRLYTLLKKDLQPSPVYGQLHHAINLGEALNPSYYDVNKLNRIFTTTTEWVA